MCVEKCDLFNIVSTSINDVVVERYETFDQKLGYFYRNGGTDLDLISCVRKINHKFLSDIYNHFEQNSLKYSRNVDSDGFSALYYFRLRPINEDKIWRLIDLGFEEIYPSAYRVDHFENYFHSYYHHANPSDKVAFVFLGRDSTDALDVNVVHSLLLTGYDVI